MTNTFGRASMSMTNAPSATRKGLPAWLRWLLVPIGALAGFIVGWLMFAAIVWFARLLLSHETFEQIVSVEFYAASAGAVAACATVLGGVLPAPARKRTVAVLVFLAGAAAAWQLLGSWFFPESHPRAYQHSSVPFIGTCLGGLAGVAIVYLRARRSRPGVGPA